MSRALKFRAWNKNDGCWFNRRFITTNLLGRTFEVVEDVEQYTGLKDKNGKEIYEGDILRWMVGELECRMTIRWYQEECRFKLHIFKGYSGDWLLTDNRAKEYEVIGNIHENGDLLECGEDVG